MPTMGRRNDLRKVKGHRMCDQQPMQSDIGGRWSYPWADMRSGDVIVVPDPSRRARSALTAAAAQWTRRNPGTLFATGEVIDPEAWPVVRTGWWCCRVDGCEIEPPDPPELGELRAQLRAEKHADGRMSRARSGRTGRIRRQRIEPVQPLVTATEWSQAPAAPEVYADWDRPRDPAEVF